MLVPLDWLKEWISVPVGLPELAERFTMAGLEVDSIAHTGPDFSEVVVGEVVTCTSHPNADRLSVCEVDVGGLESISIVCGAPNVASGQKVAVAQPGVELPDGTRLKKSRIRGVASSGMICSARELGLSEEHEGILVLDPSAPVGESLAQVVPGGTDVLEIAILANRGDCTSMLGIAREVKAYLGGEIREPDVQVVEAGETAAAALRVQIDAPDQCHRYEARIVRGVRVGPSPDWLRDRLEAAGVRSVNYPVDAGNLAMLEFGQPVHVFDLDCIGSGQIRVRTAIAGETVETLDGAKHVLEPEDLVIADPDRVIAIAGVMGSLDSEVTEKTTDIVIESAHFDASAIRRTARRLGITSDAAYRFERGIDSAGLRRAADRVAFLLSHSEPGEVASGVVSADGAPFDRPEQVVFDPKAINRILGTSLSSKEQVDTLARLSLSAEANDAEHLVCQIPSYRNDLRIPEDIAEEVARIHGLDAIPAIEAASLPGSARRPANWGLAEQSRNSLAAQGFVEVLSFPFLNPQDLDALGLAADDERRRTVTILNPVVDQDSKLRSTLVPSLLHLARENFNRQAQSVSLFEVARVFVAKGGEQLPDERLRVSGLLSRAEESGLWPAGDTPLFFQAKGVMERLLLALGVRVRFKTAESEPFLHPGASCWVEAGGKIVGALGELHPKVISEFGLPVSAAIVDLDLSALSALPQALQRYNEVSRHPQVRRDLAVVLDSAQPAGDVLEAIRKQAGSNLFDVAVFDRYEGRGVPDGRVSIAFRLVFQRNDRTLTDTEVSKACEKVVRMLAHRFSGELR